MRSHSKQALAELSRPHFPHHGNREKKRDRVRMAEMTEAPVSGTRDRCSDGS